MVREISLNTRTYRTKYKPAPYGTARLSASANPLGYRSFCQPTRYLPCHVSANISIFDQSYTRDTRDPTLRAVAYLSSPCSPYILSGNSPARIRFRGRRTNGTLSIQRENRRNRVQFREFAQMQFPLVSPFSSVYPFIFVTRCLSEMRRFS